MSKKTLFRILVLFLCLGTISFWISKNRLASNSEKPKTTEEILAERNRIALKTLETDLGTMIRKKDWVSVKRAYDPSRQLSEVAQIIRAIFISGDISSFGLQDHAELQSLLIRGIETLKPGETTLAGLAFAQIERLPTPPHGSENNHTLNRWLFTKDSPTLLKRTALRKLVLHDSQPDPKAIQYFKQMLISSETLGVVRTDWFQDIAGIRNHRTKEEILKFIAGQLPKFQASEQSAIMSILAGEDGSFKSIAKQLLFKKLKQVPVPHEACLRTIGQLMKAKALNPDEIRMVSSYWKAIPKDFETPYVIAKRAELERLLEQKGQ